MSTVATKDSPEQNPRPVRTGGRVRSEGARRAVLDAAAELLEEAGYGALTIEGVARHANVAGCVGSSSSEPLPSRS